MLSPDTCRHAVLALAVVSLSFLAGCGSEPLEARQLTSTQQALTEERGRHHPFLRVRRDVRTLTPRERKEYVQAVLKLKKVPSPYTPGLSYYDQFVAWHRSLYVCDPSQPPGAMPMPHGGPLFLPWHRQYLLLFEKALRQVSGNKHLTVPYWDWTRPESTAAVFRDDFMGGDGDPNDGYVVHSGPFRKGQWPLTIHPLGFNEQPSRSSWLVRGFGTLPGADLPSPEDVQASLSVPLYDVAPFDTTSDSTLSFRNNIEGFRDSPGQVTMVCAPDGFMTLIPLNPPKLHNSVHGWVGGLLGFTPDGRFIFGTMGISTSPNDPVFFLHHANVDRIWARWQRLHGIPSYLPVSGQPGNNIDDMLMPFHEAGLMVTPADLEDTAALGYRYE
ncbi:tyrosinase family protein [Archangium violaceum]|uniref:tyrosinase family protein n=1 Tax=Archangium violaceum TaxID=83451 RepID=UPI00193AEAD3|nr:tyrosinase family protein [Archangium violaceum]QRK11583.1 tyrosinase family protein [Archangium violaceum]